MLGSPFGTLMAIQVLCTLRGQVQVKSRDSLSTRRLQESLGVPASCLLGGAYLERCSWPLGGDPLGRLSTPWRGYVGGELFTPVFQVPTLGNGTFSIVGPIASNC
ncbi:hypothetical protein Acr_21g0000150 [Actinidia rufa]|uniref:Uncharacterized protein n=1 Tax=Actinidia rufa TaxID=165716 RepID=A0A7J0GF32_9ERIC|nr:hypothetical protein Acr_21g0000150 [Actinidia rufa]